VAELYDRFEALRPWFTRFVIDGKELGGTNSYDDDYRVDRFFEWMGRPTSILELSSFEGGHSVQLAAPPFVGRLIGLEARQENIERAQLAVELLGKGNVDFIRVDLDKESLERFGRFDAVFCAGLLYHLAQPWRLIEEIAKVTDRLFLDTHYSDVDEVTVNGYVGSVYHEGGYADPLSGLSESSFWMTLPCLMDTLSRVGFVVRHRYVVQDWGGYGPRIHLAAFKA
jgi:SAM-dependent methyltransferase